MIESPGNRGDEVRRSGRVFALLLIVLVTAPACQAPWDSSGAGRRPATASADELLSAVIWGCEQAIPSTVKTLDPSWREEAIVVGDLGFDETSGSSGYRCHEDAAIEVKLPILFEGHVARVTTNPLSLVPFPRQLLKVRDVHHVRQALRTLGVLQTVPESPVPGRSLPFRELLHFFQLHHGHVASRLDHDGSSLCPFADDADLNVGKCRGGFDGHRGMTDDVPSLAHVLTVGGTA
jgi:hypothetical protein